MLLMLDIFFTLLHLAVVGVNLFAWIPKTTRRLHRWCVGATAFCWFGAGLVVGNIGYCPLTDWHWRIKYMRGETGLPNSFITYLFNEAGLDPAPGTVNFLVGGVFAALVLIALFFWWKERTRE